MKAKRVAVTGIGIVSPLGHDTESTWQALLAGKSGIAPIANFDASAFPTTIAAEVKQFDASRFIDDKKMLKSTVPFTRFALAAAEQALEQAGIRPNAHDSHRWGAVVGSGMMTAEFSYWERFAESFAETGQLDIRKLGQNAHECYRSEDFGKTLSNSGLALLLKRYGIKGYANSVHTACASGGQALGLGMHVIRRGIADVIVAGGFDSMINPIGVSSFCLLGALSTYNNTPTTASRPFDLTRNGFVLGEGAAFLVLESWEHATARGASILAELAGEGNSLSSYRITDSHPSGDGAIQAIEGALKSAGLTPDAVDYINAHGTSTKMNDLSESNAIKAVFESRLGSLPVSSTKGQTGHLIAAAGAIEAGFSVLAIRDQMIPPTANLTTPDPDCQLDYVTDGPRHARVETVMSNSFGFGGSNSCLIFRKPTTREVVP